MSSAPSAPKAPSTLVSSRIGAEVGVALVVALLVGEIVAVYTDVTLMTVGSSVVIETLRPADLLIAVDAYELVALNTVVLSEIDGVGVDVAFPD